MKKNIKLILVSSLMVLITACTGQAKNALVLDMDVVAKATNRDTLIADQVKQAEAQLNQQLAEVKKGLQKQLKVEIEKIKSKDKKAEQIKVLEIQAQQEMQRSILSARQKVQQFRASLVEKFRAEVLPIAKQIAQQRKVKMVRLNDRSILWADESLDISDEVITELQAKPKQQTADKEAERIVEK